MAEFQTKDLELALTNVRIGSGERARAERALHGWANKGVECTDDNIRLYFSLQILLKKVIAKQMPAWKTTMRESAESSLPVLLVSKSKMPKLDANPLVKSIRCAVTNTCCSCSQTSKPVRLMRT
jgi:hypothetical protein